MIHLKYDIYYITNVCVCRQTAMGEHFVYDAILGSSAMLGGS